MLKKPMPIAQIARIRTLCVRAELTDATKMDKEGSEWKTLHCLTVSGLRVERTKTGVCCRQRRSIGDRGGRASDRAEDRVWCISVAGAVLGRSNVAGSGRVRAYQPDNLWEPS